jgi:hypothetical protein
MGGSKGDLIAFPEEVRREIGYQLEHVQEGMDPDDWKPMLPWAQGCAKFASETRQEPSAAFIWQRGRRGFMYCTVSKRRPRKLVNRIWIWRISDSSQYR